MDAKGNSHWGRPMGPQLDSKRWSPFTRPLQASCLHPAFHPLLSLLPRLCLSCTLLSAEAVTRPFPNCACRGSCLDLCHLYTLPGLPQPCMSSPRQHQLGPLAGLVSSQLLSLRLWSQLSDSYIQALFSDPNSRMCRFEGKVF